MRKNSSIQRWGPVGLAAGTLVGLISHPTPALAQGCICARQTQPILGAQRSPYLKKGQWQLSSSYRYQHSNTLYSGHSEAKGTPDVSRTQHIFDVSGTYAFNKQTNLSLTVPFADLRFGLGVPPPSDPDTTHTSGIGDVTLVGRHWLLDTEKHTDGNVSLGLGIKLPTGNYNARDSFRNGAGTRAVRYVDISSQPGDGGTGVLFDIQAFHRVGSATAYASGTYLANPRNTNGTPSLLVGLMGSGAPPRARVNSVPDQYVARVGAALPIKKLKGVSVSLGARLEGVPPSDLFGDSEGFRFAGYVYYVEPGISYTRGPDTFALSVPVRVHRNIQDVNTTPGPDVATVVPYSVLFSYSRRFGK